MANLLPDRDPRRQVPAWPAERRRRFARRLGDARRPPDPDRPFESAAGVAEALEAFGAEPSGVMLDALLAALAAARGAAVEAAAGEAPSTGAAGRGRLVVHWFGRGLGTGEAEVASRGLFDAEDRPPLGAWLERVERPVRAGAEATGELGVLAWLPDACLDRAAAGIEAEPRGALGWLADEAPALAAQLDPVLAEAASAEAAQSFST